jgi:type VI secretion system protein ImpB
VAKQSSQKFVARNRPPRVQIEYEVEVYGAEKKMQLPFVMGVMADLSGKPADPLPSVDERKFLEIDVDNFDDRMRAMKPRVAFSVPNTLTGEGNLSVDLTFESLDDFSPGRCGAEGWRAEEIVGCPYRVGESNVLYGRQDGCRRVDRPRIE